MPLQIPSSLRFLAVGAALSLLLTTFLVFYAHSSSNDVAKYALKTASQNPDCLSSSSNTTDSDWEFISSRDADNLGLSETQCRRAFPKLFYELDKSVASRKDKPITLKELESSPVEDGMVRGVIDRGELYILDFAPQPHTFTRAKSTLHALHRSLTSDPSRHTLPTISFLLTTDDLPPSTSSSSSITTPPIWSYTKQDHHTHVWLIPPFTHWTWPEVDIPPYRTVRHQITTLESALPFEHKTKQLLWRGAIAPNPPVRNALLAAARGQSWSSIHPLDWASPASLQATRLPISEHCRYQFLAHTEGRSFSGRGAYLLNCRSVLISHPLVWRELHHAALVKTGPEMNYVEVKGDWSDLGDKMRFLLGNEEVAEGIAARAVRVFRERYLTPAAEACYWRELVRGWARVGRFEGVGEGRERGVPFEEWVLMN
ncbi:hypothetical protein BO70DRAFT_377563 [Aspergillus heteromorphus CBS 117.55]|uniref:Glycosyl transferase CAP10 domain-containing protein n=1 Tax=Aspergillus heteromorphus CBS 117.55 TaxID=1448321 RepID=A0A317WRQ5_9EURO|nr:uncharacterized protein BO70DRAFT_377563 [Aspergillus heteromorphus CBS 117.55]PWY89134.1 hypothetical protein BO70DRAFT_377563 [Aspergillus heteromorphus CBS 117.55]